MEAADGRWFLRRILPYRTLDNRIDGVVVTFADVTSLKRAEVALRRNRELQRLATVVTDSNDAITVQQIGWNDHLLESRGRTNVWLPRGRGAQD